jgi:hypothetical protein
MATILWFCAEGEAPCRLGSDEGRIRVSTFTQYVPQSIRLNGIRALVGEDGCVSLRALQDNLGATAGMEEGSAILVTGTPGEHNQHPMSSR